MLRTIAQRLSRPLRSPAATRAAFPIYPPTPRLAIPFHRLNSTSTTPTADTLASPLSPSKPSKSSTKRRQKAASQPLRQNPPGTRGPVLDCVSYTTADRYDLAQLSVILRTQGVQFSSVPTGDDHALVISLSERSAPLPSDAPRWLGSHDSKPSPHPFGLGKAGEIWVFGNGSYVTWGITELTGKAFLTHVIRSKYSGIVEYGRYDQPETEDVDFVVDPTEPTVIKGNLIILGLPPTLTSHPPGYAALLTRYTLSLALSRSSALSAVEDRLDTHLASVAKLPSTLAKTGKQPLGRKQIIKKIGELLMLRDAVNFRGGGLEDTPEIYWSEPELETYFDSVSTEFELKERIDAVNQKVDYAHEVQTTLRALLTEASGHRMELIIIMLIAVEVCIVLIREGRDLHETFMGFFGEKVHELQEEIREAIPETLVEARREV